MKESSVVSELLTEHRRSVDTRAAVVVDGKGNHVKGRVQASGRINARTKLS